MSRTRPSEFESGMITAAHLMNQQGELQAAWEILRHCGAYDCDPELCDEMCRELIREYQRNPDAN